MEVENEEDCKGGGATGNSDTGGGATGPSHNIADNNAEAERELLAGFSRITTRDRDEVIQALCHLTGYRCGPHTAAFFLDMNNWNLQEAACCYLELFNDNDNEPCHSYNSDNTRPVVWTEESDRTVSLPLYSMKKVFPKDEIKFCLPGSDVEWFWMIKNTGTSAWPEGCCVRPEGNEDMPEISAKVDSLGPYSTGCLNYRFVAPVVLGSHVLLYRLHLPNGMPFGDILSVNIEVKESIANEEQVNEGTAMGLITNDSMEE